MKEMSELYIYLFYYIFRTRSQEIGYQNNYKLKGKMDLKRAGCSKENAIEKVIQRTLRGT